MTPLRRLVPLSLTLALLLAGSLMGQGNLVDRLAEIPRPKIDTFEEGVQRQINETRAEAERLAASADAASDEKAAVVGVLGMVYFLYDFTELARPAFELAHDLDRDDFRWPYYQGMLLELDGDLEGSLEWFDVALALRERDLSATLRRASLLLELGREAEAEQVYDQILQFQPELSAALVGKGRCRLSDGDVEVALGLFERALPQEPEGSVVNHYIGMAYRRLGNREEASEALARNQHVSLTLPDPLLDQLRSLNVSREAFFKAGTAAMRRKDYERAVVAFEKMLEAQPDDPVTHFNIGMAMTEMGRMEEAERNLRIAIEGRDNYRDAHFNLGLLLAHSGRIDQAEEQFRAAAASDSEDLTSLIRLADVLNRLDRPDEAIPLLREVVAKDPGIAEVYLALGEALVATGEPAEGRIALNRVLEFAPGAESERSRANYWLAAEAEKRGAVEEALKAVEASRTLDDQFSEAWALEGRLRGRSGDFTAAIEAYDRALVSVGTGRVELAERWWFSGAVAHLLKRDEAGARGWLERAVEAQASSRPLRNQLARLYAASGLPSVRDGERALQLAQQLWSEEQNPSHAETLAMALAEVGRFEDAARLQSAVVARVGAPAGSPEQVRLDKYRRGEPERTPWLSGGGG